MTDSTIHNRMINAWQQAWQMRCCPPDSVLAGEMTSELKQHLEICPACRRERADSLPEIQLDFSSASSVRRQEPGVGELWSITGKISGWGPKYRYYSPPVVLITAMIENKAVTVHQIFGDPMLAGPDDILLDDNVAGFVEAWNRYTLNIDVLAHRLGTVSVDLVHRVEASIKKHNHAPPPGSLLWFFRQLEVETGWFFAEQSIVDLLETEKDDTPVPALRLCYTSTDALLEDLKVLPVILPDSCTYGLVEDILVNAMAGEELLPMAAAEKEPEKIQILLFSAGQGAIQDVKMVTGQVTMYHEQDSTVRVSGICMECPDQNCEWIFRWQSGAETVKPLPGQYGAKDGIFWAVFPTGALPELSPGKLIVRVIAYR